MSFLACMTSIFHARQFYINSEHIWHILKAKKFNWFFTPFSPFFSTRPTSESYNDPLKVLTEGSMVEYLPVGSQEDPQTIIDKKNFEPWNPKSQSQPSVQSSEPFCGDRQVLKNQDPTAIFFNSFNFKSIVLWSFWFLTVVSRRAWSEINTGFKWQSRV